MLEVLQVSALDPGGVLAAAIDRRRAADRAEVDLLRLAAHWADLHPVVDGCPDGIRVDGGERLIPLAGPGAPEVAEFAPAELAAALGMSSYAGQLLVGDALELRHRLPRCWQRILAGKLQVWRGRQIAQRTRGLSPAAAAWVDAQVAPCAHKIGLIRLAGLVEAAIARFSPDEAAAETRDATAGRGVWVSKEMTNGNRHIAITADALDATAFDDTVTALADTLRALGDADQVDERRAKAIGLLAAPQAALNLLTGVGEDGHLGGADRQNPAPRTPARRAAGGRPKVTLYVHLSADAVTGAVAGREGIGRIEGLGPVTTSQLSEWLGRSQVTVTPVRDAADATAVDGYEVPAAMAETVYLRSPCCPFPWCTNLTRHKDLDHISPYRSPDTGGPPGQTRPANLAPLCRRHHRLKTHGGWGYTMAEPGLYLWRSPHGRRYLVDHTGTTPLIDTA